MDTDAFLATPTKEQTRLLEVVWQSYALNNAWPIYDFADLTLFLEAEHLDALDVLRKCPYAPAQGRLGGYGWFWWPRSRNDPIDDEKILLTVAGLSQIPAAADQVQLSLNGLAELVARVRALRPSPFHVQRAALTQEDLHPALNRRPPSALQGLGEMFEHEPSWRRFFAQPGGVGPWMMTVDLRLRPYADVVDVRDYTDRLLHEIAPHQAERPPEPASSFELPEAIDYLNAIWHLRFDADLFGVTRCKASAELSHTCETREEFTSRVTSLYRHPRSDSNPRPQAGFKACGPPSSSQQKAVCGRSGPSNRRRRRDASLPEGPGG